MGYTVYGWEAERRGWRIKILRNTYETGYVIQGTKWQGGYKASFCENGGCVVTTGPHLITWVNFNTSMDK